MGYLVELNTLLGVPKDFDVTTLAVGQRYSIVKERERAFPLHIAMLLVDSAWNFYGYCVAHSSSVHDQKTQIEFEMLTMFPPEAQKIYKENFLAAASMTGEVK